ncbi:MAG: M14 family metallopeptidase [Bacteroidota bacterium]
MNAQWLTYFERSGLTGSPRYEESMKYFRQFSTKTPYAKMFSIGTSPQGRSIECLVISMDKEFTPEKAKKSGKAVVLIQNGIHAGEIEGKDAWMILLREILVTKEKFHLLDNIILLVIPILSVDGHERISRFNRPNQNGPEEMGWRTNSWNLNLNRDYMKADTPEIRAFLKLFTAWLPDLFIDNHTTNGADYQYHITYALEKNKNIDPKLAQWGTKKFLPFVLGEVEQKGFLTAPYIEFRDGTIESGIEDSPAPPRLSTGYTAAQNRLGLLVETHSLKPYENRVRSTYAMNVAALELVHREYKSLLKINRDADTATSILASLPLVLEVSDKAKSFRFKGFRYGTEESAITGNDVERYSEEPIEFEIPFYYNVIAKKRITIPKAYIIPKEFSMFIEILHLHGITVEQFREPTTVSAEQYEFTDVSFAPKPYEGRQCVSVTCVPHKRMMKVPAGTFIVPTKQRTRRVIAHLLEPESPDSFVAWGFLNAFFERKEYAEAYVMEPIAQMMLDSSPELQKEFEERLNDETFRNDPAVRLDFFYKRSPYFDINERTYPIFRWNE